MVNNYTYLGTNIDVKLSFEFHVDAGWKERHINKYIFFGKMRGFMLTALLWKCFTYCFYKNKNRLQGMVRVDSKIATFTLITLRTCTNTEPSALESCRTNRLEHSCVPADIGILNKWLQLIAVFCVVYCFVLCECGWLFYVTAGCITIYPLGIIKTLWTLKKVACSFYLQCIYFNGLL